LTGSIDLKLPNNKPTLSSLKICRLIVRPIFPNAGISSCIGFFKIGLYARVGRVHN